MKRSAVAAICLFLCLFLFACSAGPQLATAKSEKTRVTSPDVPVSDLEFLVRDNNDFAFLLYQVLKGEKDGNIFFSPYGVSFMMAMAYGGAGGETAKQMAAAMHYQLNTDKLHPAFNELALKLDERSKGKSKFTLNIASDAWGQKDFNFLQDYLDMLVQNYGAGLKLLNFKNEPEAARQTINDYISQKTNGIIKDLIPEGGIDNLTRLILTNAIYFSAEWQHKFNKAFTNTGSFTLLDGEKTTVPMMRQTEYFPYATSEDWKAIELPYAGEQTVMDIIMPDDFRAFEANLDYATLDTVIGAMHKNAVALTMPKFKYDSEFKLNDALKALGMPLAFDEKQADFSGITEENQLSIGSVNHKAYISVDEEKTEAVAAGDVIITATSTFISIPIVIDRPFIFVIRDIPTGAILFLGRVLKPAN